MCECGASLSECACGDRCCPYCGCRDGESDYGNVDSGEHEQIEED